MSGSHKIDWKSIEEEIKNFAAKNNGILSTNDDEYLEFVGNFFCDAKYAVSDTQKTTTYCINFLININVATMILLNTNRKIIL